MFDISRTTTLTHKNKSSAGTNSIVKAATLYGVPKLVLRHKIDDLNKTVKRESMQKASPRFKLTNIDGKTPTPEVKKEKITNWKDSPHLISLKRGVEKHGRDWNAILHDKTLNLPSVTAQSLRSAYERHLRSQFKHLEASKNLIKWKDSPHLISLKRGIEKHGTDWDAIARDKTLNLPSTVTTKSMSAAYYAHIRFERNDVVVPANDDGGGISFPKSNLMMMLPGGPKMKKSSLPKNGTVKWKDSPHLISLKRGVEKHGEKWTKILQDKTLNLPSVSADALRNAYRTYLDPKKKSVVTSKKKKTSPKNGTVKWKDSPHLNNLKRGVEKHGEKWTKILHDKTLNLPNVSADALRNAYTKYFNTKPRIVTPRKPLPPPLRPSRYVVACYQQKGLKDELIVTTNIAASFAHAGKKICLISANPKNPTVDMQRKRIAAREHNLKMRQLRQTNNTSSWVKSGIDVEEEATTTTTTSDSKTMWPQDIIPDMSTLKFDLKRTESSEKASPPTLASYLSASMKGSEEASSWLEKNVSKFEDLENVY